MKRGNGMTEPKRNLSTWFDRLKFGDLGRILVGLGVVGALLAFGYSVEAREIIGGQDFGPTGVANLDKVAIRHMLLAAALATFVSGWIAISADHVAKSLSR